MYAFDTGKGNALKQILRPIRGGGGPHNPSPFNAPLFIDVWGISFGRIRIAEVVNIIQICEVAENATLMSFIGTFPCYVS